MNERMLDYLRGLEQNNNRDWYHANKAWRDEAFREFEALVGALQAAIQAFDASIPLTPPKDLTFKQVRDTRFSADKSPYTPAFRAHIAPRGKLPIPVGYYLMIKPGGGSFLGGGLFADMFKDATAMVRDAIAAHGDEWGRIVTDPTFTERFTVGGASLKNVPKGYDPHHPQGTYLKNKSWYLELPVPDERVTGDDFVGYAAGIFKNMQPFNAFLNRALADFQMPER